MYRIDTGQARTDLYGIGKGAAQVVDLTPLREQSKLNQQQDFAEKQAREKERQERDADLQANLAKIGQMKIMPKDQQMFADKASEMYDYVKQNQEALRSGDAKAMMGFQQMYGDYSQKAKISEDAQNQYIGFASEFAKNGDKYSKRSHEWLKDMGSTKTAGQWNLDPTNIVEKINTFGVTQDLEKFAKERANATQTPYLETFDKNQALQLMEKKYLSDPALMRQLNEDFNDATEEERGGAANPLDFWQKRDSDYLVQNVRKAGPQASGDKKKSKWSNLGVVVHTNSKGEKQVDFNFTDKSENPPFQFDDPENPGKTIKMIPMSFIQAKDGKIWLKGTTVVTTEDGDKVGADIKLVPYDAVSSLMNNTFGIDNPYDLLQGTNVPEHVSLKNRGVKKEGTTAGEKKTYTKAELTEKAKAAGYTYDEYYKLVKDKITVK